MSKDCLHELKQGEIWVCNTDVREVLNIPTYLVGKLPSARIGKQAYDINGKLIEKWYMRPLIIHKSEEMIYERIMNERFQAVSRKYY